MDRGARGLQAMGPQGVRHDLVTKPLPPLSPVAWESHANSGFVYLLHKHQLHTCCVDRARCWAFWDLPDETLTPRLQFLHISVWFPLRCHLCKSVESLLLPPLQNTFFLDTLFVSKRAKLPPYWEDHDFALLWATSTSTSPSQVLLAPVENCWCRPCRLSLLHLS